MWNPPPPPRPPPQSHQPPPDLHHHHHHHSTYDRSSLSPYPKPQFNPPPPPPPPLSQPTPPYHHHHHQPQNYPNFYPNHNLPPPPPDYRLPPAPPLHPFPHPNLRSPSFTSPIYDHVDFRVSWPEPDHHASSSISNELRFSGRCQDELGPSMSTSFNRQETQVGEFMPQPFGSGMNVDRYRAGRYDFAGSEFCGSSGFGGFARRSTSPMEFKDDRVHGEWDCKRQRFEMHQCDKMQGEWDVKRQRYNDVHRLISGVQHDEFERSNEEYVVPNVQRKSALLRIVDSSAHTGYRGKKPKYSGHSCSSKTIPFKDKYSSPAKHKIKKEGQNSPRENTPVHVSFKSNSLVAKQIAAPSSPVDITNNSSTPRNRKLSKLASPSVHDLTISSREENQSPMKLPKSGFSSKNTSHHDKISELTVGSDWSVINRNLFDVCTSSVEQADGYDKISSAENRNSSEDKKLVKRRKKQNLSEYRVPLSMRPVEEQSRRVRLNSPKEVLKYNNSKESCHLISTSSTETGSLVKILDDHSHNLLHQHIDEAAMKSSMKGPACEQSDSQEKQLSNDYCFKEVVSDITATKVKEINCVEPPHGKCIQISPLEVDLDLSCNTIIDKTCLEGIIEKGISEEKLIVDDDIKVGQDVGFSLSNARKRKERGTPFIFSDAIPAAKAHENDIFDKVTIDSAKSGCASPDPVEMKQEVKYVMDMGVVPLDFSCTNWDVTTTALNEASSLTVCGGHSSLVPVSSESVPLLKDRFNISSLAEGSSVSAGGIEIAISTANAGSDPDVQNTMASHERMSEGKTINISTLFEQKSTEVALGNATERVGNSLVKTNLVPAGQVGTLSSISSGINKLKPSCATSGSLKYQKTYASHAPFRTSLSVCFASPKVQSSKVHTMKSRTWHRSDNESTVSSVSKASGSNLVPPKHTLNSGKPQSAAYIRKGNSLVRNPSPVASVFRSPQLSTCPSSLPSSPGIEDKVGFTESKDDGTLGHNRFGNGISDNLLDIQNNEPGLSLKSPYMPPTRPMTDIGSETNSSPIGSPNDTDLVQLSDEIKLKETTENQNQSMVTNTLVAHAVINNRSCVSSKSDCILPSIYVPYQLTSASGPRPLAAENAQNNQIVSSDGYYKSRMNQIIRTPSDDQPNKEGIHAQNMVSRTSTLQSYKGTMRKPSNSSLVWTLRGTEPTGKLTENHFQCKRPASWKRNSRTSLNSCATSMLRKLTLYRNHNTLYKRSTHGLSLRKYKVVAVGGCNLKWSKSMEKRSKKVKEDATRAVVAAELLKREQGHPQNPMFTEATKQRTFSKSAHYVTRRTRGRIFRIGSVRYRMDPSRKTLRRVIDDGSANVDFKDKDSKKAYFPTRLAVGKNEYIRIGNGNQLIRDPKKRIRMLASEKIRWSLHNVRQRSMKKRQFCQFYTRFGKCNKDDGKCPYIHDSSKIAVCTKFLRGMCSDPDCKLTHKVIPERMEDCSYFLQGMCCYENCPYRHVNVNPKAETCEGFLRGYCADGDECQKKHSYVCHIYEETGTCPDGSKCKLHHPKKQKTKHTVSRLQDISKGRYFGIPALEVSDPQTVIPLKLSSIKSSNTFKDGEIPEFISLDDSDGDDGEINVTEDVSCLSTHDDNDMDIEPSDLNTFVKPTRIMNGYIGNSNTSQPGNSRIRVQTPRH